MFEFLFKFPLDVYQRGEILLEQPAGYLVVLVLVASLLVIWSSFRPGRSFSWQRQFLLPAMRIASLAGPQLEVMAEKQQQGMVAVLIDDSVSMQINDTEQGSRGQQVKQWLEPGSGSLREALESSFATRMFAFGSRFRPIEDANELTFQSGRTDYAGALQALQNSAKALKDTLVKVA